MTYLPHPFSLRQLQYVVAVAEHRNFRKASEACHVSQPSLSAQLALVEDALGITLFERNRRRVLVTQAGASFVEKARTLLMLADDVVDDAKRASDPFTGVLRLGIIPTVGPYLLPEMAPALRLAYPRLVQLWTEEKTPLLINKLERGELDAAIVALEADLGDATYEVLGVDRFVFAAGLEHRLGRPKRSIRLEELHGEQVLLLDDGHCFRSQTLAVCSNQGAEEMAIRATSLPTLVQMVAGGNGVTLLPAMALATENRLDALRIREFAPNPPHRTLVLAWRRGSALNSTLRAVAASLRESCTPPLIAT